ncbi:MAG: hypothetical protein A2831_02030 [Candidatus Yanofskybacteria bacterium RIFCSPHIGHO2_01_FULL_44_17]|uniref:Uncharacterized protein n=1 Tax=Candidatus Yanofskybacteria bacterium RIFCSPHIGHO2_01_FULL_44_17 TaxID=1802668 RepID=A0A1F8EV98_9BACT|nr:MAG: hypothetical protein A2831_02030 [Candidatus Yanofskybacteria bacterium RIFCSPHIGHO2_01_FULL_44_17]
MNPWRKRPNRPRRKGRRSSGLSGGFRPLRTAEGRMVPLGNIARLGLTANDFGIPVDARKTPPNPISEG